MRSWVCLTLLGLFVAIFAESEPNRFAPILSMIKPDGETAISYNGFIVTNEKEVSLIPALTATDNDTLGGARFICGYRIYTDKPYEIPFRAEVSNHMTGAAKLVVMEGFDLSKLMRHKYKFEIAAFDCGAPTLHSERIPAVVQILRSPDSMVSPPLPIVENTPLMDLPTPVKLGALRKNMKMPPLRSLHDMMLPSLPDLSTPIFPDKTTAVSELKSVEIGLEEYFEKESYVITMREATLYDSILRLRPITSKSLKDVCGYDLITSSVPFSVDNTGNVRNTAALDFSHQRSYIFQVVAKYCSGLTSKPTTINIQVSQMCTNGWKDLPVETEYRAGTKAIHPFADTWFDTCRAEQCEGDEEIDVTVSLDSKGKLFSCDHDTFSIQSQKEACGADTNSLDLLPQGETWTKDLEVLDGHDSAYKFDGKTAVNVPSNHSNHTLGELFTISLWMQHGEEKRDGHKEHVLCNSDGDGMNRHHYSLFVHNCRLVFLLRKEASQVSDLNTFMPAEWRYSIPHVCDGKWHHYALSVTYPEVKLYVDGQAVLNEKGVVEVVDDWALHPTDKVHFTQLTVGGCWQGTSTTFGQHFDGSLAGVSLTTDTTQTERVIKCMNSCGEKLQFHSMDLIQTRMSIAFNTELTEITVRGTDADGVKAILREIGYSNTNTSPKPGYRTLNVRTNYTCSGRRLDITAQSIPVMVSPVTDPKITITGVSNKLRTAHEFAMGVDLFTELFIVSSPEDHLSEDEENRVNRITLEDISLMQKDLKKHLLLDRCQVRINAPMSSEHEQMKLPESLLIKYLLDTKEFNQGFDISGSESFTHYEEVLRETYYINGHVDGTFEGRTFTVTCYDMNGRFSSNEYSLRVGVMNSVDGTPVVFEGAEDTHNFAHIEQASNLNAAENVAEFEQGSAAASGNAVMIVVIVICGMLLVGIIGFAITRIKQTHGVRVPSHQVTVEDGPEMEWDNSTLNITVNPLEQDTLVKQAKDTEDLSESEEELMSSDDEAEAQRDGLEWDNSTLY